MTRCPAPSSIPPTREDCDVAVLFIETSGCLPMCGHGTIGTVTIALENGLIRPATPGKLAAGYARGPGGCDLSPGGPVRRGGAPDQCPRLSAFRRADGRGRGHGRSGGRCRPMAAISMPSWKPRRTFADMADFSAGELVHAGPQTAGCAEREIRIHPPRTCRDIGAFAYPVDRRAARSGGAWSQCGALWRQGD